MKKCELCKAPARTYCESDQAVLCWDCDAKVHGANFLVARHSRNLLCGECQSPTPWKASGARLGRTVSVCERCVCGVSDRCEEVESQGANDDDDLDTDAENDDLEGDEEEDCDEDDEEEEEEEGENQVVPWSSTPPPPAESSSGSEDDFSETVTMYWRKRMRQNRTDLTSTDDDHRSKPTATDGEDAFSDTLRPLKRRRAEPEPPVENGGSTSAARTVMVENLEPLDRVVALWP